MGIFRQHSVEPNTRYTAASLARAGDGTRGKVGDLLVLPVGILMVVMVLASLPRF
jgi:hypothetical protein